MKFFWYTRQNHRRPLVIQSEEEIMKFLQVVALLVQLGQKYEPLGAQIAVYIEKGDWAGLLVFLGNQLGMPNAMAASGQKASDSEIQACVDALKAHVKVS